MGLGPPAARLEGILPSLLLLISNLQTSLELFDVEQRTFSRLNQEDIPHVNERYNIIRAQGRRHSLYARAVKSAQTVVAGEAEENDNYSNCSALLGGTAFFALSRTVWGGRQVKHAAKCRRL